MSKDVISVWLREIKKAEQAENRARKAAERERRAREREAEKARKEEERLRKQLIKAEAAERKRLEKEAKAAHIAQMEAQVESLNAGLLSSRDELANILQSTLEVDDYVDLALMRAEVVNAPFDRPDLQQPTPAPLEIEDPPRPRGLMPRPPSGIAAIFGRKKYQRKVSAANRSLREAIEDWQAQCAQNERERDRLYHEWHDRENNRLRILDAEFARHQDVNRELAGQIDQLIRGLEAGDADAVESYIQLVLDNSVYPEEFPVTSQFSFSPELSELKLRVNVPEPGSLSEIKDYKYAKASDEIKSTSLTAKALREQYANIVNQVAIRSIHEIFEADRREIIRTIELEVGTEAIDPATGLHGYFAFVAVGSDRSSFLQLELARVAPAATLERMGASLSPNPYGLKPIKAGGVRSSAMQARQVDSIKCREFCGRDSVAGYSG